MQERQNLLLHRVFSVMFIMAFLSLGVNGQLNVWRHNGPFLGNLWGYTTVAVAPSDRNILYTGTYHTPSGYQGVVFKTVSNGPPWTPANSGMGSASILKLLVDPADSNLAYALTYHSDEHLYKTTDGGASWALKDPPGFGYAWQLAMSPSDPSRLFLAGSELYTSLDRGETWTLRQLPNFWDARKLGVHREDPNILFIANCEYYDEENCNPRLYRTLNGGSTWSLILDHPADDGFGFITFDPFDPNTVYTSALGYYGSPPGIYKSTDLGTTWTFLPLPESEITQLEFDPRSPSTVYAVGMFLGVGKSTDGGITWAPFINGLREPYQAGVQEIDFSVDGRFIHAATSVGVFSVRVRDDSNSNVRMDFDGDGRSDVSVFRPSDRVWYLNRSTQGFSATQFGLSTDKITPADYDGDGKTDISVYRDGVWCWLKSSDNSFNAAQFGVSGDVPVPADYTGDGRTELAIYRNGAWWSLNLADNQVSVLQFGISTDKTVPADYDGDGVVDQAIYRNGEWHLNRSTLGYAVINFGLASDRPVVGDYDGDGKADPAVYRDGIWHILGSAHGYSSFQFGLSTDIPTPADYDGDGKTDASVFRDGTWYLKQSTSGISIQQFGLAADKPVPSVYLP